MARQDQPDDIEALLAEVERTLGGSATSGSPPAPRPGSAPASRDAEADGGGSLGRVRRAVLAGGVAAAGVWVLFLLLPFLGSVSGAAGAFVGAFVAVLLLGRRGR